MSDRNNILDDAFTAPETLDVAPGVEVRRLSLQSLSMLARIGSPVAEIFSGTRRGEDVEIPFAALAEFVFVHAAPLDEVKRCVYRERGRLAEAADEFCARVAPAKIPEIVAFLLGDVSAARLAQAHAMRRSGAEPSKNAPSPAE